MVNLYSWCELRGEACDASPDRGLHRVKVVGCETQKG